MHSNPVQKLPIWTAEEMSLVDLMVVQIGGSARGYQALFAWPAAWKSGRRAICYASPRSG
jgi:hypothetical protein